MAWLVGQVCAASDRLEDPSAVSFLPAQRTAANGDHAALSLESVGNSTIALRRRAGGDPLLAREMPFPPFPVGHGGYGSRQNSLPSGLTMTTNSLPSETMHAPRWTRRATSCCRSAVAHRSNLFSTHGDSLVRSTQPL